MTATELPSGVVVSTAMGGTLRVTGTGHETVGGRFIRQSLKREWSAQRQQIEYVERIFDRVERVYHERYYHPVTGAVVFEKRRPIEDQSPAAHGRRGQRAE